MRGHLWLVDSDYKNEKYQVSYQFQISKCFLKPYSESHFHRDVKIGCRLSFPAGMMEKMNSWDIYKIFDTDSEAGKGDIVEY